MRGYFREVPTRFYLMYTHCGIPGGKPANSVVDPKIVYQGEARNSNNDTRAATLFILNRGYIIHTTLSDYACIHSLNAKPPFRSYLDILSFSFQSEFA